MNVIRLFKRDLSLKIVRNPLLYFIPIAVSVVQCNECYNLIQVRGSILDYYMYCMRGMQVYNFDPGTYFVIPIYWFILQIGVSYCIAYYAHGDFYQYGKSLFLCVKDRTSWWDSKCIWCIVSVLIYYVVFAISIAITAIFTGAECKMDYTIEYVRMIFGIDALYMTVAEVLFVSFLLPCIMSIGLCLLQILAGFFTSPVFSFACMCGIYVLSAYYTVWFLPGNYTMLLRSKYCTQSGVNPVTGCVLGIFFSLCAWIVGRIYFESKDIV